MSHDVKNISVNQTAHSNEPCHSREWVMSHIWMSHVPRMETICKSTGDEWVMSRIHVYTRVTPYVWVSHITHRNPICVWFENQMRGDVFPVQHIEHTAATHCNTLQHTANTLQTHCKHTATHCNTLQTHCKHTANTRQHTATHGNTLQPFANQTRGDLFPIRRPAPLVLRSVFLF